MINIAIAVILLTITVASIGFVIVTVLGNIAFSEDQDDE